MHKRFAVVAAVSAANSVFARPPAAASTFAEHSAHSRNIISGTPAREWSEWDERHGRWAGITTGEEC